MVIKVEKLPFCFLKVILRNDFNYFWHGYCNNFRHEASFTDILNKPYLFV